MSMLQISKVLDSVCYHGDKRADVRLFSSRSDTTHTSADTFVLKQTRKYNARLRRNTKPCYGLVDWYAWPTGQPHFLGKPGESLKTAVQRFAEYNLYPVNTNGC